MAYTYKMMHLDPTPHNLQYKYGPSFTPTQITYHQTATNRSAMEERDYLNSRTDEVYAGFHLIVDDQEAIECIPLNIQTWHTNEEYSDTNLSSIGVEIAYSTSDNINLRNQAIQNGAILIANLMKLYQISLSDVLSHHECSGSHCPHDIIDRYGEENFENLIQAEYDRLSTFNPVTSTSLMLLNEFHIGEEVILYAPIPGFISSKGLVSTAKVEAGTYLIEDISIDSRHPLKLLKVGNSKGIWVDANQLFKPACGFFPSDGVYVRQLTPGYETAMGTDSVTTIIPGYYKVSRISNGSKHPVYLVKEELTSGAWVDTDALILQDEPPLYREGQQVKLMKNTPGYKTSSSIKQGKILKAGTYYIYQYEEGQLHPLNLTTTLGQKGLWVNVTTPTE